MFKMCIVIVYLFIIYMYHNVVDPKEDFGINLGTHPFGSHMKLCVLNFNYLLLCQYINNITGWNNSTLNSMVFIVFVSCYLLC